MFFWVPSTIPVTCKQATHNQLNAQHLWIISMFTYMKSICDINYKSVHVLMNILSMQHMHNIRKSQCLHSLHKTLRPH